MRAVLYYYRRAFSIGNRNSRQSEQTVTRSRRCGNVYRKPAVICTHCAADYRFRYDSRRSASARPRPKSSCLSASISRTVTSTHPECRWAAQSKRIGLPLHDILLRPSAYHPTNHNQPGISINILAVSVCRSFRLRSDDVARYVYTQKSRDSFSVIIHIYLNCQAVGE